MTKGEDMKIIITTVGKRINMTITEKSKPINNITTLIINHPNHHHINSIDIMRKKLKAKGGDTIIDTIIRQMIIIIHHPLHHLIDILLIYENMAVFKTAGEEATKATMKAIIIFN
jgi:hypothetical protein